MKSETTHVNTDTQRLAQIQRSIVKKFRSELWGKFTKAIKVYDLIQDGDHIAVCISGGKDSMVMAKLFQELHRHGTRNFSLTFLVMDPGYNEENRRLLEQNAALMDIPIRVFHTDIFSVTDSVSGSPCYLCARMRRGNLYAKAQELGCNKIALGHHYDDVIETILMSMLHSGQIQSMMPKLHATNFAGMELIRPMYLIREEDILRFCAYNDLHFLQCACRLTEALESEMEQKGSETADLTAHGLTSKRKETKELIRELKKTNPYLESNIFRSVENVHLSTIIAYKDHEGNRRHFLDAYDNW